LYIKNVSADPFAEFLIGSGKIYKFNKDVNIDLLSKLDFEMKINDKIFVPDEPYALEFNILMNTKSNNEQKNQQSIPKPISQNQPNIINNLTKTIVINKEEDGVNTDDNDLLEKVSSMMNINN
jgi:hypothetical protein